MPALAPPGGREFLGEAIDLSLEEIGELSNSERILHYANSFASVYTIIDQRTDVQPPDFSKHWGESASAYMARLGIGDPIPIRKMAQKESSRYADIDSYWHALVPYIYREAVLYPDAKSFLIGTEAMLAFGDGEPLKLESHTTYQGLVQEYYAIHARAVDAAFTVLGQAPPI